MERTKICLILYIKKEEKMDLKKNNPSKLIQDYVGFRPIVASGGDESFITVNGILYKLHVFTDTTISSLNVQDKGSEGIVEYLVVGGGGGGGMDMGGGGGGGGLITGRLSVNNGTIDVKVGDGGWGGPAGGGGYRGDARGPQPSAHQFTIPATSGESSFLGNIVALGGGFGGSSYRGYTPGIQGGAGGSGGGASGYNDNAGTFVGGNGTGEQGFRGGNSTAAYYSGGGGGSGGLGADSTSQSNGGAGTLNDILGYDLYWSGGGGGSAYTLSTGGNGGIGGGGGGAVGSTVGGAGLNNGQAGGGGSPGSQTNTPGGNAGRNTGGGGGGGSHYNLTNKGGDGGSGIVVVRYPIERPLPGYITNGLKLYLDAEDPASYPGSGSVWKDLAQGLVFDSANTQMPYQTVQGAKGFTGNGSGFWRCTSGFQNVDMASDYTLIIWIYTPTIATRRTVFEKAGTTNLSYEQEIAVTWEVANNWTWYSRVSSYDGANTPTFSVNTWNMISIKTTNGKVQGSRRTGFGSINGANWGGSYTSNSVNAITPAGEIRVGSGYAGTIDVGTIGAVMVYQRLLSNQEILQNFNYFKERFGK
jgi:hypothetical protein